MPSRMVGMNCRRSNSRRTTRLGSASSSTRSCTARTVNSASLSTLSKDYQCFNKSRVTTEKDLKSYDLVVVAFGLDSLLDLLVLLHDVLDDRLEVLKVLLDEH